MNPNDQYQGDDEVRALTQALALTENGGKVDLNNLRAGQSGEMKSIFQYTPNTWKAYSNEIYGKEVPLSHETEMQVTAAKVAKWLHAGYKPEQIFSMWNAGSGEPNAWTGKFSSGKPSSSTAPGGSRNSFGVAYDVPGYVKKGMTYYQQARSGGGQQMAMGGQPQVQPQGQMAQVDSPEYQQAVSTLRSIVNKYTPGSVAQAPKQPPQGDAMAQLINGQKPPMA